MFYRHRHLQSEEGTSLVKSKLIRDQSTKRPELPLTLLEMAFSYAALNERTTLSKQDIIQAIRHSNRLRKEWKVSVPHQVRLL